MSEVPHPDLGYVKASRYRRVVLAALSCKAMCPTEITKETNLPQSRISEALSDLANRGLIACVNPHERKGKIYHILQDGEQVYVQLAGPDK